MKGIIKKDLYMIKNYCRSYILFLITFLVFPMINEDSSFLSSYLFMIPSMVVIAIITFDERNKWETYLNQLPIKPQHSVLAKYIIGGSISTALLVLYSICANIRYGIAIIESLKTMSVIAYVSLAITLPFYFRFDSHIGRIAYYVSLGAIVALAMMIQFSKSNAINSLSIDYGLVFSLVSVMIFIVSYFVSVSFYKTRLNKLK